MKKLLLLIGLLCAGTVFAATSVFTVPQGGTGASTLTGWLQGNGTSAFTASTSPHFSSGFTFTVGTGTSATTTNFFATTASTTNFFGGGLPGAGCAGGNALQWSAGRFSCAAVVGGSASTTLLTDNNTFTGSNLFNLLNWTRATGTAATTTSFAITGTPSALLKTASNGAVIAAISGTDYENPLTFSTGLTRSTNTITVNSSQNISTLSNLTTNGFIKTSGGTGALSVDTNTYLTGNQSITLSGDISGSGTTAITTTIGAGKVTNAMLAGSITASNLVGSDIATVGTITSGVWNAGAVTSSGTGTFANLLVNGSSTLQNFTFVNATGTSATTTNFFATNASTTSFRSNTATIGTLTVGSCSGCSVGGGSPGGSDTQFQYNNAGAFAGTSNLTISGGNISATTSQATTTSLYVSGTASTSSLMANTATLNTLTVTNKALIGGTPASSGEIGRDTTQGAINYYDNGQLGTVGKIIAVGTGSQSFTNSTISDQDYTSIYTLPANSLYTNKVYRVTLWYEYVMGVSTATVGHYLKLGSTKVYAAGTGRDLTNSLTRGMAWQYLIVGRAAPSAASAVSTENIGNIGDIGSMNSIDNPVNVATNGTLTIVPGVTYSATGSTETAELQAWMIEELN